MQGGCRNRFIQYRPELSMNSLLARIRLATLLAIYALLVFSVAGCDDLLARKQKKLHADTNKALREHSYDKALGLARELVKLNPQDNGAWDRLVQAQFGLQDYGAVKQTLQVWQHTAKKASPKLDEYIGD